MIHIVLYIHMIEASYMEGTWSVSKHVMCIMSVYPMECDNILYDVILKQYSD